MPDASDTPNPVILDLSRSLARGAGRAPTGIDRVEQAYLNYLATRRVEAWGICRTPFGYLFLDQAGLKEFANAVAEAPRASRRHVLDLLRPGVPHARLRLETAARKAARSRAPAMGLRARLRRLFPDGCTYLSVGHSSATVEVLRALPETGQFTAWIMVHDAIPLTHPQFCRPESVNPYRAFLDAVRSRADRIICPSHATAAVLCDILEPKGTRPDITVSAIGLRPVVEQHERSDTDHGSGFIFVGTLEPRKNVELLVQVWEALAEDMPLTELPELVLAGERGWYDQKFFDSLEAHRLYRSHIKHKPGLTDAEIDEYLSNSRALLFPSHAEGYGYPPLEAARLGVPVVSTPLDAVRETLGSYPVYVESGDVYGWAREVADLARSNLVVRRQPKERLASWTAHFEGVFDGWRTQPRFARDETEVPR